MLGSKMHVDLNTKGVFSPAHDTLSPAVRKFPTTIWETALEEHHCRGHELAGIIGTRAHRSRLASRRQGKVELSTANSDVGSSSCPGDRRRHPSRFGGSVATELQRRRRACCRIQGRGQGRNLQLPYLKAKSGNRFVFSTAGQRTAVGGSTFPQARSRACVAANRALLRVGEGCAPLKA
jgi:hypothetical protein